MPFTPPSFANVYPDDECFSNGIASHEHAELRSQNIATSGCNLWWIELGGDMHSIYDADKVRAELLAAVFTSKTAAITGWKTGIWILWASCPANARADATWVITS